MRRLLVDRRAAALGVVVPFVFAAGAVGDDWTINITVDNQYSIYFGNNLTTNTFVGSDTNWTTTDTWNAVGMNPTDYAYVATASDRAVAQGFLADFNNTTQNYQFRTGGLVWEVFAAGPHLMAMYGMAGSWPANLLPTQAELDTAITYAETNNLWVTPAEFANWDNRIVGNITTWGHRPGINAISEWIWHAPPGFGGNPFSPGANHDEFLVFRVQGIPTPGAAAVLALGGLLGLRRRR